MRCFCYSEPEAALHADAPSGGAGHGVVDDCRLHSHAEVGTDVEVGQLGIHVGVDHREQVDADEGEDAQVAVSAVGVLALAQGLCQSVFGFTI